MPGPSVPTIALYTLNAALTPIVLRPNGVGAIDELLTSTGDGWECVDDVVADDDLSYVYNDYVSEVSDLWTIDPPTPAGNITSVRIVARAKSNVDPQAATGIYKLLYSVDGGLTIQESPDFNLTSSYANISYTWSTEISSATDWTWVDIANLQIGIICSSPSMSPGTTDLTLRPISDYTYSGVRGYPGFTTANLWSFVDDATPDDDSTYIFTNYWVGSGEVVFNATDHTTETGPINSVTVYFRARNNIVDGNTCRNLIETHGTTYYATAKSLTMQYALYSDTWLLNPFTGAAWTWAEIDALRFGFTQFFYHGSSGEEPRTTQCYAVVNYSPYFYSPEIRTTQAYAEIRTTSDSTCYLPKPVDIQITQSINTNALNFWSGNREVYGLSRSSKRMIMSGILWDGCTDGITTCEDIIQCVRTLGKLKEPINIAGLRYTYMNTDYLTGNPINYNIISFGWKQVAKKTNTWEWMLELEFCD
jgi:hypothetical protein